MGFAEDIQKWAKKVGLEADVAVRSIGIKAYALLTEGSPVDSGQFRANWNVSVGNPVFSVAPFSRKTLNRYAEARRRGENLWPRGYNANKAVVGFGAVKAGDTMYITNAMPYAKRLNEGWSKQRGGRWVEATVEKLKRGLA
ncbi:MAG: hypothetical protein JRD89_12310 [Deltaproteobacteria bacterium]|nr:hypothetical protein [Deltaproteobacteria bacterium]